MLITCPTFLIRNVSSNMKIKLLIIILTIISACSKKTEFDENLEKCLILKTKQILKTNNYDFKDLKNSILEIEKEFLNINGLNDFSKESYKSLMRLKKSGSLKPIPQKKETLTQLLFQTPSGISSDLGCYEMLINIKEIESQEFHKKIYEILIKRLEDGKISFANLEYMIDLIPNEKFNNWIYRKALLQNIYPI